MELFSERLKLIKYSCYLFIIYIITLMKFNWLGLGGPHIQISPFHHG